jgi:tetratricopeptide (TPR) repeat protein
VKILRIRVKNLVAFILATTGCLAVELGAIAQAPVAPKPVDALLQQGWKKLAQKDYKAAMGFASRAIRLDKKNPEALVLCGEAHGGAGEAKHALDDFNEAIELRPDYAMAYYLRGKFHQQSGAVDRAMADYDRAIALQPDYVEAVAARAELLALGKR